MIIYPKIILKMRQCNFCTLHIELMATETLLESQNIGIILKKKKKKEVQLSLCLAGYLCKDFDILRNFLDFPILSNNKKKVYKFLLFPTSNFI